MGRVLHGVGDVQLEFANSNTRLLPRRRALTLFGI
jgi:hypothetical protein